MLISQYESLPLKEGHLYGVLFVLYQICNILPIRILFKFLLGGKKMIIIQESTNNTLDWVIAISNIVLTIVTIISVIIALHAVKINVKPKAKIFTQGSSFDEGCTMYKIKLVNQRPVPVNILGRGFYYKVDNRTPLIVHSEKKVKLDNADADTFSCNFVDIDKKMIDRGFSVGDLVDIIAFYKTMDHKTYEHPITHLIRDHESKLRLNKTPK